MALSIQGECAAFVRPVRARLVKRAQDWRWSSVRAHLAGLDDPHVATRPLLDRCAGGFADLIATEPSADQMTALRAAETIGRPLGSERFLDAIAARTGRDARPQKRGRKKRGMSKLSP